MTPRSEEFLAQAQERLAGARDLLRTGHAGLAASAAYFAMLHAARAALSEQDRNARTHSGTWTLFSEVFVRTGRVAAEVFEPTKRARHHREASDYEAADIDAATAEGIVDSAQRFVDAVVDLLGGSIDG